jgi:hypothetical protein
MRPNQGQCFPDISGPEMLVFRPEAILRIGESASHFTDKRKAIVQGYDRIRMAMSFGVDEIAQKHLVPMQAVQKGEVDPIPKNPLQVHRVEKFVAGHLKKKTFLFPSDEIRAWIDGWINGYGGAFRNGET